MVSTRSQSVLSAEAAHGDTAANHGEVNSAAPTPRRSGRLRSSGAATTPAIDRAPPRSVRTRKLRAIQEEQDQEQQQKQEEEQDVEKQQGQVAPLQETAQQEAAPKRQLKAAQSSGKAAPRGRRSSAAASPAAAVGAGSEAETGAAGGEPSPAIPAGAASQAEEEAEHGDGKDAGGAQPLKAGAAVVDLLAEEMFAALNGAFGEHDGSGSSSSSSESEPESDGEQQQGFGAAASSRAAAAEQHAAAAEQPPAAAADGAGIGDGGSVGSESESDSEGEGRGGQPQVPSHLRWRPELTLPCMQGNSRGAAPTTANTAATASVAAAAAAQVVRRGGDGLHLPPPDERAVHKAARKAAPDTAGRGWYDLPATQISEEVKQDLRMLRLRGALDPKAHYKKLDSTKFPKYFQMGTVVEGAADFYSGRLTNKQRKRTFTEEIMADPQLAEVRKKRYNKMQEEREYWSKKKTGRKTNNERRKKPHRRAKH